MHEAWLRLSDYRAGHALPDAEFQRLASHVMRRILTDHARRRTAARRDARRNVPLTDRPAGGAALVVEVDDALRDLAEQDPELAQLVELRFFGGHTLEEVAAVTGVSLRTVHRRWQVARAWLLRALAEPGPAGREVRDA